MTVFAIIRDHLDALLHPSARQDAMTSARHRAFIAPRLLGSLVALASLPLYLAVRGAPSVIEVMAFAWLIVPILYVPQTMCFGMTNMRYSITMQPYIFVFVAIALLAVVSRGTTIETLR